MLEITLESPGWPYCGLTVVEGAHSMDTGPSELVVLPLEGGCEVTVDGESFTLEGREDVFTGITDFVYVPRDSRLEIAGDGRVALPAARCDNRLQPVYVAASDVAVELRGGGQASRQINNFCGPGTGFADKLLAVEVLTPEGNWSSYPPHKHDEDVPGVETALEEIYYFEVAPSAAGAPGLAYQRVYGSVPGREIDVTAEVRSGDAIVMPHGYHGPSMAAPGYDLYYLNVMAGPGERAWRFT